MFWKPKLFFRMLFLNQFSFLYFVSTFPVEVFLSIETLVFDLVVEFYGFIVVRVLFFIVLFVFLIFEEQEKYKTLE